MLVTLALVLAVTAAVAAKYALRMPAGMWDQLQNSFDTGSRREQFGALLCGVLRNDQRTELLAKYLVVLDEDQYVSRTGSYLEVRQEVSAALMRLASDTGLCQIDIHTHPFTSRGVPGFSALDDAQEHMIAGYIASNIPGTMYGSLVLGQRSWNGRVWASAKGTATPMPIEEIISVGSPMQFLRHEKGVVAQDLSTLRQIAAFGGSGQQLLQRLKVAVVGVGGLGALAVERLVRLGVRDIVIVDPDVAETSNLNRVAFMTKKDAQAGRLKVDVVKDGVLEIAPDARVVTIARTVLDNSVLSALRGIHVMLIATDDHSSRVAAQRWCVQYLVPLIHLGVNLEAANGELADASGEVITCLPGPAGFCLRCANAIDLEHAAWEVANPIERAAWAAKGYVSGADVPTPSVGHLNGVVACLAVSELHALICGFKPVAPWLQFDQMHDQLMAVQVERDPECPWCSEYGLLALGDLIDSGSHSSASSEWKGLPPPTIDSEAAFEIEIACESECTEASAAENI